MYKVILAWTFAIMVPFLNMSNFIGTDNTSYIWYLGVTLHLTCGYRERYTAAAIDPNNKTTRRNDSLSSFHLVTLFYLNREISILSFNLYLCCAEEIVYREFGYSKLHTLVKRTLRQKLLPIHVHKCE